MAVVQTGSLLSFFITSLVQLTRMGSLVGYLRSDFLFISSNFSPQPLNKISNYTRLAFIS